MDETRLLLGLQHTDLEITRAERRLAEMPEKRAILAARKRISDIQSLESRADAFIAEVERVISRIEDEVAMVLTKLESEQAKLLSGKITNPKEAQNISLELDALRRRKEETESKILEQMEKREKVLEQRAKVITARETAEAEEAGLVAGFKDKGGDIQDGLERLARDREKLAKSLKVEMLKQYETLRSEKGGVAVGRLIGSTCGACRMELPTDRVADLRASNGIGVCSLCHRILVIVDEEDE